MATASLPAPIQLPGVGSDGRTITAVGGLDAADGSVSSIVRVAPGHPRDVATLPQPVHDVGVATLGQTTYAFGGGTASGPIDTISAITSTGVRAAGRLPLPMSDTTAVALGHTAYVIGGDGPGGALRSVLAFRPGDPIRRIATLPHPLRYAAAVAIGSRIYVAGGTNGTTARREVLSVDPASRRVTVAGRLPTPIAHAAGAAIGHTFYVLGGRGDALDSQQAAIWAIDVASGRVRRAGRLPVALSDLSAAPVGGHIVVVGGRDAANRVHRERWTLARGPALVRNVYAADVRGDLSPTVAHDPARVYVPNSQSNTVDVISQRTGRVVDEFAVGAQPQHVTPSWDLKTLWVTNDLGNSLTPIDPRTGRPGRPVRVMDPYNLYFTVDGRRAIVVSEARRRLDFRDPHTMALRHSLPVPMCDGVDHMDYTASGHYALVSCEFAGRLIVVDLHRERVVKTIDLRRGAMPQDVKLSPDGRTFYVADMADNGVWLIDAGTMTKRRFQATGRGAHGVYPSRNAKVLYVSNRNEGSVSVLSFRTGRPIRKWHIPGGGSPDMGGVSADGRVLWLTGRYNGVLYAISTSTGRLLHRTPVGSGPHGACVWPQPGRYSIGHTGIMR